MQEFNDSISEALAMLASLESDLAIEDFSPNEKKVFYSIVESKTKKSDFCNITQVVDRSGMSRSTVYKTLKKLTDQRVIDITQSQDDKREFLISLS